MLFKVNSPKENVAFITLMEISYTTSNKET